MLFYLCSRWVIFNLNIYRFKNFYFIKEKFIFVEIWWRFFKINICFLCIIVFEDGYFVWGGGGGVSWVKENVVVINIFCDDKSYCVYIFFIGLMEEFYNC